MTAANDTLLGVSGLMLRFGGLVALDKVDFEVRTGEVFGLIGPNGAGKTTMMNAISGVFRPDAGHIEFGGRAISGMRPHQIAQLGVARTFQVMRPFVGLTVRENVAIGARFGRADGPRTMAAALRKADETLEQMGIAELAQVGVGNLTTGQRKRLELARALAMDPKLLLLDEVMAGLNPREIDDVMGLVKQVNGMGVTVMLIEHLMKAVMGLCDRILVLHHGRPIALGTPDAVANDEAVITAYLGERYARQRRREATT